MADISIVKKKAGEESVDDWFQVMHAGEEQVQLGAAEREIFNYSVEYYSNESYADAYEGFSELAKRDSTVSQYFLGVMYLKGYGVLQDFIQAHIWFNISASRGNKKARQHLEQLTQQMSPEQVAEAQRRAQAWVELKNDPVNNANGRLEVDS